MLTVSKVGLVPGMYVTTLPPSTQLPSQSNAALAGYVQEASSMVASALKLHAVASTQPRTPQSPDKITSVLPSEMVYDWPSTTSVPPFQPSPYESERVMMALSPRSMQSEKPSDPDAMLARIWPSHVVKAFSGQPPGMYSTLLQVGSSCPCAPRDTVHMRSKGR